MNKIRLIILLILSILFFSINSFLVFWFSLDKIAYRIYLEKCGVEILNQSEDGDDLISIVRVLENNKTYDIELVTNYYNLRSEPVSIYRINGNTIISISFDSISDAVYKHKYPETYYPVFNNCTGIILDRLGSNELFPVKIQNINEAFENIIKIDSLIQLIPEYPNYKRIKNKNNIINFYSRTKSNDTQRLTKKMIVYFGEIINPVRR